MTLRFIWGRLKTPQTADLSEAPSFSLKIYWYKNFFQAKKRYLDISNSIFDILCAIASNPHSIFIFSFPLNRNRLNPQQPLSLPKVCSTRQPAECKVSYHSQNISFRSLVSDIFSPGAIFGWLGSALIFCIMVLACIIRNLHTDKNLPPLDNCCRFLFFLS